jgi:hypothetical protein
MDIAGPSPGQSIPISASAAGIVQRASQHSDYGNVVIVYHGTLIPPYHTYTLYAHLRSFAVGQGQTVQQGALLGYSGQTGSANGVHLHFELILLRSAFRFPASGPIGLSPGAGRYNPASYWGTAVPTQAPLPQTPLGLAPLPQASPMLRYGSRGEEVWVVQQRLAAWLRASGREAEAQYFEAAYRSNGGSAYYGQRTQTAVAEYQRTHTYRRPDGSVGELTGDGVVGPNTWSTWR